MIGKNGFYYQTGPGNGKFYNYVEVEKVWVNSGEAQNGAQEDYCNIEILGMPVIRFQFFYADEKGVNYLIKRVEATANEETAEYLIDGKVFGRTRIVIAMVLLIVIAMIDAVVIQATGYIYFAVPGAAIALFILAYMINSHLFFQVMIDKNGFYCSTNQKGGPQQNALL